MRRYHSRIASLAKVRRTILAEMKATTPRSMSSRVSSAQLQRKRGPPVVAGSWHTRASTSTDIWDKNTHRLPRARSVLQGLQAALAEPLAPPVHDLGARPSCAISLLVL